MTAALLTPTAEQQAILDAAATGDDVKITAGAGAGKSSTLRLITKDMEVRGQTGISRPSWMRSEMIRKAIACVASE